MHIILVGLGVVGVADVASYGQAQQLAAEVVFEASANNLLAVIKIFRPDETHDRVDQHGLVAPGNGIGPRLQSLLVAAVMRASREGAALAGLEIHYIVADSAALQFPRRLMRFIK